MKLRAFTRIGLGHIGLGAERTYVVENLGMLLASGMSIPGVIASLEKEARSRRIRNILKTLREDIESGVSLSRGLEQTGLLRPHVISLLRVGEESGRLAENLKVITAEEEKRRLFRSRLIAALMYPAFVFTLSTVIGVGIAWFILPRLASVFRELDVELPLVTKVLIRTGEFLGEHGVIVVPGAALLVLLLMYVVFVRKKSRHIGEQILFALPGTGKLLREVELARFGYIGGTLLGAGIPVLEAVASLAEATPFHAYRALYATLRENIEAGDSFEQSLTRRKNSARLIPLPLQQMIAAAEQSGHLSETLVKIGATYDAKAEITTKNLSVVLEPILLVIVWVGVVAVALAIILPIYSLIGGLNAA